MPASSGKRKRPIDLSPVAGRCRDALTIMPRQFSRLSTNSNVISSRDHTPVTCTPVNDNTALLIPQDCCYHCLTRGGNAAYECFTEDGEELCTRCIRDRKNRCRIPTSDEAAAAAARCPRCAHRGFKQCDGGDPCDTCKRNKTPHLCQKQPAKKLKPKQFPKADHDSLSNNAPLVRSNSHRTSSQSDDNKNETEKRVITKKPVPSDRGKYRRGEGMTLRSGLGGSGSPSNTAATLLPLRPRRPIHSRNQSSPHATSKTNEITTPASEGLAKGACNVPITSDGSRVQVGLISTDEASSTSDSNSKESVLPVKSTILQGSKSSPKFGKPNQARVSGCSNKGIDLSLPPLSSIEECMSHMAAKAVELGLLESLKGLEGRPIRIATMCSGTESPLLALKEISRALKKQGHCPVHFKHEFSAEIEVFKQAFIERNFSPPILFRDVRDFLRDSTTTATTAYGAEVDIPTHTDILVVGCVCKDLSRLNSQGKKLEDGGESGDTWLAVYTYAKRFRPSIVLMENVKSEKATWDDVVSKWNDIGYEAAWMICDTKKYYLPQTRERMYMVAIEHSHFGKGVGHAVSRWKTTMKLLQRHCSSPYEAFLPKSLAESSGYSTLKSEPDWALCKLRNDHIRSEKRLGILSPRDEDYEAAIIGAILEQIGERPIKPGRAGVNPFLLFTKDFWPPDFASRRFYNSQSPRVHDAIDIAHLESAKNGIDPMYKMALWDVSQNVDRFRAELGISHCITPYGQHFASNRQSILNGSDLLLLQGLPPPPKLILANETQKDLQNLAGNAMSTTVIAASLISAIISGSKAFRPTSSTKPSAKEAITSQVSTIVQSNCMQRTLIEPQTGRGLDFSRLLQDAKLSARMCSCEFQKAISKAAIRICSACGHSACMACAGNPKHVYKEIMSSNCRKQSPQEFISRWRSELPPRLELEFLPGIRRLVSKSPTSDPILRLYRDLLCEVQNNSPNFYIGDFVREHRYWKITYNASHAWLELRIGEEIKWLMFLRCPSELPGNNALRDFLKTPIMHGIAHQSLFGVEWKARLPNPKTFQLRISGSTERARSWRNRLGLQDYKMETVPSFLDIQCDGQDLATISGTYEYLQHCGTASNSLYKKSTKDGRLFLFLDPDLIGNPEHDCFVFSNDLSRKDFGDSRMVLACVDPSWRPWHIEHERVYTVNATVSSAWASITIELKSACIPMDVGFLDERLLPQNCVPECSKALTFLDVLAPTTVAVQTYSDYSWALEQPRSLPSCASWQPIDLKHIEECPCAPPYPKLIWSVDDKGVATAHPDRKAAAVFERAMKKSPPMFHLEASRAGPNTHIQVALNIMSLIHRARRRLSGMEGAVHAAWRLVTNHVDLPAQHFARFELTSNANDPDFFTPVTPTYLRGTQLKSLRWMINQELGKKATIRETEEAIHAELGWRVEARTELERYVQGGVLADQPSFGKTVATIGLIQNEFDTTTPEALVETNRLSPTKVPGRIDSMATIIVCPPHITYQWRSEIHRFLPTAQHESYNLLVIEKFSQLESLNIEDILASRVVIVSWALFAQKEYLSELAHITALPEPTMTSRRGIGTWIEQASHEISNQFVVYERHGYEEFTRLTKELLEERLRRPEFRASLPVKIKHGSAYQSFGTMQSIRHTLQVSRDVSPSVQQKIKTRVGSRLLPLLHLFQFNRIVVDEYHYLNTTKRIDNYVIAAAIKQISAHKRWVLSGTPAIANFSDVNQIASFLGISLGRYHPSDSAVATDVDQTDFENFICQTEVVSRQWHEERRSRAQRFLDDFVRQNEAEIRHIRCVETLVPVKLDAAHHAVYIELSQHLISQQMRMKKLSKKSESDRTKRLNESLEDCLTAEEALLKAALLFKIEDGAASGLDHLIKKRSQQICNAEKELSELMSGFEGLPLAKKKKSGAEPSIGDLYNHFKNDVIKTNWLGDEDVSSCIRGLILKAEKSPTSSFSDPKASDEQRLRLGKQRLSQLRDVCLEFAQRKRSQRFIQSIWNYIQTGTSSRRVRWKCSSPSCKGTTDRSQLHSIPHCGHSACSDCLVSRSNDENCVHPGCTVYVNDKSLIRMADLGSNESQTSGHSFGKKLDAIIGVIENMPETDQGIVFAPNDKIVSVLEEVFEHYSISYLSPGNGRRSASAKVIEDFKTNKSKTRKKLLILNLASESAAGVNLTNANHIIFVAPLLAKSQYEYDSTMAQAIARSRRYGQGKKVHIYHVVAERTIDVDILEHRHKRSNAIFTLGTASEMPSASGGRVRTKFVKNSKGEAMLVPRSWLAHPFKRAVLGLGETTETFTSLVSFSATFEREDDD